MSAWDAMKTNARTTIRLPADVLATLKVNAALQKVSMQQAIEYFIRAGMAANGLPVIPVGERHAEQHEDAA